MRRNAVRLVPVTAQEKAVRLEQVRNQTVDRGAVAVMLPHVLRDRSIGCGICEDKCPVGGEVAIRVFVRSGTSPA